MTLELLLMLCISQEIPECSFTEHHLPESSYIYLCVSPEDYRTIYLDTYHWTDPEGRTVMVLPTRCIDV